MRKFNIIIAILTLSTTIFAQGKTEAIALLDKVSDNMNSYSDVEISFTYHMDNNSEDIHQSKSGIASIQKERFQITIDDLKIIFDGSKRYTIMDDEVTISNKEDKSGISNPTQILGMYKEGYTIKWDIEQKIPGKKIQYIRLKPIDSNSEYKYILIGCDTNSNELYNVIYTDKQGTQFKLQIDKLKSNQNLPESLFSFDKTKYPEPEYMYTDLNE